MFNVADFGARHDGATDDSAAIQAAFTAAAAVPGAAKGTVLFPSGNYYYNSATPIQIPMGVVVVTDYPAAITGGSSTTDCFVIGPGNETYPNYPPPSGFTWDSTQEVRMSLPTINHFPNGTGFLVNGYNGSHIPYIPAIANCLNGIKFDGTNAAAGSNTGLEIYCDTIFNCHNGIVWYSRNTVGTGMQGCYVLNCYVHPNPDPAIQSVGLLHDYPAPANTGVVLNGLVGTSSIDGAYTGMKVNANTAVYAFDLDIRYMGVYNKFFDFAAGSSVSQCDWTLQTLAQTVAGYGAWSWQKNTGYAMRIKTLADGQVAGGFKAASTAANSRSSFDSGNVFAGNHLPLNITVPAGMAANTAYTVYAYSPLVFGHTVMSWTEEQTWSPNSHVTAIVDNSTTNANEIAITVTNFAATGAAASQILGFATISI